MSSSTTSGREELTSAADLQLSATMPNRCTGSLGCTFAYWEVPRNFIKRRLGQRNSFCIATAASNRSQLNCPDISQTAALARSLERLLRSKLPSRSGSSRSLQVESRLPRREVSPARPTERRDP